MLPDAIETNRFLTIKLGAFTSVSEKRFRQLLHLMLVLKPSMEENSVDKNRFIQLACDFVKSE